LLAALLPGYSKKLIEQYGADIRLPDLREEIAQCSIARHDACIVYFVDLVTSR